MNDYFSHLDKSYYSEGLNKLEQRWPKSISLKGDQDEKLGSFYFFHGLFK